MPKQRHKLKTETAYYQAVDRGEKLFESKFGKQFIIDPSELKGTVFEPLISALSRSAAYPYSYHSAGINEAIELNGLYQKLVKFLTKTTSKTMSHEQEQATAATPIEHAMLMGNGLRRLVLESMGHRRTAIARTEHDKPEYQAALNCMEADLLTALATVIQDYIDRMTNELELDRQRKQMDGKFSGITED